MRVCKFLVTMKDRSANPPTFSFECRLKVGRHSGDAVVLAIAQAYKAAFPEQVSLRNAVCQFAGADACQACPHYRIP